MAIDAGSTNWVTLVFSSSVVASLTALAFTTVKDWWKDRAKVHIDKQHSALDVAGMLEGYAGSLADLIDDINEHHGRDHPGNHGGNLPDLPKLPDGFDRRAFGIKGTAELAEFRNMVDDHKAIIASNYRIGEEDRIDGELLEFAPTIALQALELAASIRKRCGVPAKKFEGEHNRKSGLEYHLKGAEKRKAERAAQQAHQAAEHAAWLARIEADGGLAKGSYLVGVTQGQVDRMAAAMAQTDPPASPDAK